MPTNARGTGFSNVKGEYYGKKYLLPLAEKGLWAAGAIAQPELAAGAYWWDRLGGKEWVTGEVKKGVDKYYQAKDWLDMRASKQRTIGVKQTEGMKLGSALGDFGGAKYTAPAVMATALAAGKAHGYQTKAMQAGREAGNEGLKSALHRMKGKRDLAKAEMYMEREWRPRNRYWGDGSAARATKYAGLAGARATKSEVANLLSDNAMDRMYKARKMANAWEKAGYVGVGLTAVGVGYDVKRAIDSKRAARQASKDRY